MRKLILSGGVFFGVAVGSLAFAQQAHESKQSESHGHEVGNDDSKQRGEENPDQVESFLRQIKGPYNLAPGQENTIKCRTLEELSDMETRFRIEVRNRDKGQKSGGDLGSQDVLFQRYYPEWGEQKKWAKVFHAADFTAAPVRKAHVGVENVIEQATQVDVANKKIIHTVSDTLPGKGSEIQTQEMSFDPATGDMTYSQFIEKRSASGTLQDKKPVCRIKFVRAK